MSQQRKKGEKPSKYYNFGAGWYLEDSQMIQCSIDHLRNKKNNKDQGYKLFLVPVDDTGDPVGEGKEITVFRIKRNERTDKTPENAPDYQVYTWE